MSTIILLVATLTVPLVWAKDNPKKEQKVWRVPPRKARMKNPVPADDASIAIGKKIYKKECLECHGKTGKGDGPETKDLEKEVKDFRDPKVWEQSDGTLYWKTRVGRKPMPGFKKLLSKEERWHVINYIRSAFVPK